MDGRAPAQVYEQEQSPAARPAVEPEHLAMLLAEHERRKVRECAVTVGKRRFIARDLESSTILHTLNDTDVVVAFDPNDASAVAILDDAGHLITWAYAEEPLRWAPYDRETQRRIADGLRTARHLEKQTREQIAAITRTAVVNGARDRVQALDVPALPAAVGEMVTQRKPRVIERSQAPASAADIAASFLEGLK
jgi:hypothetical protein